MCKLSEGFEAEYMRPVDLKKMAFFDRHLGTGEVCGGNGDYQELVVPGKTCFVFCGGNGLACNPVEM